MMGKQINGEGSVYFDKSSGKWIAALVIGRKANGTRMVKKTKKGTRTEATKALREMKQLFDTGKVVTTSSTSLGTFLDRWLEQTVKPNREPKTYGYYERTVRVHIKPMLGRKPVTQVTRKDIQALVNAKKKERVLSRGKKGVSEEERAFLSPSSIRAIVATLRSAYSDAIKDGLVAINPATHVELPATRRTESDWLREEESAKLIDAVKGEEFGELILFLLMTGTRLGEACGVRWQDLRLDAECPSVTIAGQLQRIKGIGLKWKAGTKTNQLRGIPLVPQLAEALTELRARRAIEDILDPDGLVFLSDTGLRIDQHTLNDRLARICRKAGIKVVSAHKLRHTAGTMIVAATGDIHAAQKMLGHSQISLTADLYAHASADILRSSAEAMAARMTGKSIPTQIR